MAADWTVMVYLAGDNNLSIESLYSLTEMKRVDQDDRINIIAQLDPNDDYLPTHRFVITRTTAAGHLLDDSVDEAPFQNESARTVRRRKARLKALTAGQQAIAKEAEAALGSGVFPAALKPKVVKNLGLQLLGDPTNSNSLPTDSDTEPDTETNTGSPDTLYDFLSYCLEQFPAKHYMVILSGHGSGTEQDFLMKDESPVDSLTIQELKQVFEDLGQQIDILGFNSCLMSMAEVCYELYELKDQIKIIVGSESYSPATGWPLYQVLKRLVSESDPKKDDTDVVKRVAEGIVEEYVNFYVDYFLGGISVDQSVLNVGQVGELKTRVDALAKALTDELDDPNTSKNLCKALVLAHWEAQSYNGEMFVDLADLCDCLKEHYPAGNSYAGITISDLCTDLSDFIKSEDFVLKSCHSGPSFQYSYGVSIYFPWSRVAPDYNLLKFASPIADNNEVGEEYIPRNSPGWAKFLETYTSKTRRLPRNIASEEEFASFKSSLAPQRFRRAAGMGPENSISSMRNPPLIWKPDDCIKARESLKKEMGK